MAKLRVQVPAPAQAKDLASPHAIKKIWAEAARESRRDAVELRARRMRALHAG